MISQELVMPPTEPDNIEMKSRENRDDLLFVRLSEYCFIHMGNENGFINLTVWRAYSVVCLFSIQIMAFVHFMKMRPPASTAAILQYEYLIILHV